MTHRLRNVGLEETCITAAPAGLVRLIQEPFSTLKYYANLVIKQLSHFLFIRILFSVGHCFPEILLRLAVKLKPRLRLDANHLPAACF